MTRYVYGLIVAGMLANTMFYIPGIMINHRFDGTVMSMPLNVVSGSVCAYLFIKAMRKFPGQGLPEIFRSRMPVFIAAPYLMFLGFMFMCAGGFVLLTYSKAIQRYINPDYNYYVILLLLTLVCIWLASTDSWSVLYFMVLILAANLPLALFILAKGVLNEDFHWKFVLTVLQHYDHRPRYDVFVATTYIFSGYVNLAIFNRCFGDFYKVKHLWPIPIIGTSVLLTSFLIPIGMHGTYGVNDFTYTWVSTADAIRLRFGFIERMLYVYLLLYLSVSMLFVCIVFHVGMGLVKGAFGINRQNTSVRKERIWNWSIMPGFVIALLWIGAVLNEKDLLRLAQGWFYVRYPAELMLVAVVVFLARRQRV
jgi:hypothetical protein